jgi:protein gp37
MSDTTAIEWTDATWNPVTGCSKVSPGCAHCYAETLALTRLAGKPGYPGLPWTPENAAANVVLHPDRLDLPLRWRKPRRVFVNSMSDLFHEQVPEEFIHRVWVVMESAPSHTFQVLTKRPERMRDILTGCLSDRVLPNVWLGTSIENDRYVGRADALRETPAAVRFISAEPLLGPLPSLDLTGIDWLIVGGESGPGARPMDPDWVRDLVERADAAGCAVFVKQSAGRVPGQQGRLPDDLWARKEYPR